MLTVCVVERTGDESVSRCYVTCGRSENRAIWTIDAIEQHKSTDDNLTAYTMEKEYYGKPQSFFRSLLGEETYKDVLRKAWLMCKPECLNEEEK